GWGVVPFVLLAVRRVSRAGLAQAAPPRLRRLLMGRLPGVQVRGANDKPATGTERGQAAGPNGPPDRLLVHALRPGGVEDAEECGGAALHSSCKPSLP